jgi:hypothetical protein
MNQARMKPGTERFGGSSQRDFDIFAAVMEESREHDVRCFGLYTTQGRARDVDGARAADFSHCTATPHISDFRPAQMDAVTLKFPDTHAGTGEDFAWTVCSPQRFLLTPGDCPGVIGIAMEPLSGSWRLISGMLKLKSTIVC